MTGIDSYSTVPATNATADGGAINWAEGQPPSSVNNTARQWMADTRSRHNDLIWFQYGTGDQGAGNLAVPAVYASGTSFTIAGADVTLAYHVGRRVRAVGVSTGTIYGSISVTSYSPTTTTVTVVWDSGSLSNETLTISLSQIPVTGKPGMIIANGDFSYGVFTPTDASGAALSFSAATGYYAKIANVVIACVNVTYPATADGSAAIIGGLPYTSIASMLSPAVINTDASTTNTLVARIIPSGTTANILDSTTNGSIANSGINSSVIRFTLIYFTA